MAINIAALAEDAKKHVKKGKTYWLAALAVANGNIRVAREICKELGKRGGKKTARLYKQIKQQKKLLQEKKFGQQTFSF